MAYDPRIGYDPSFNPWETGGLSNAVSNSLNPFMQGQPGYSPMTQAAMGAFTQNELPIIQHQMQLQGLGNGPAIADVAGRSLATAMPSFIQNDLSNRLAATGAATQYGAQVALPSWQAEEQQKGNSLQGYSSAGEIQRGIAQDPLDAAREEMLRRQGLSESTTTGLFGSLSPTNITESSGGGGK